MSKIERKSGPEVRPGAGKKDESAARNADGGRDVRRGPQMQRASSSWDGIFRIIWPGSSRTESSSSTRQSNRPSRLDDEGSGPRPSSGRRTRLTFSSFGGGGFGSSTAIEALAKDTPVASTKAATKAGISAPTNAKLFTGAQVVIREGGKDKHAGALVGFDTRGKPLVRNAGGKIVDPDGDYTLVVKGGQEFVSTLQGIPSKHLHKVPSGNRGAFDALVKLKAGDKKTRVTDYINAIHGAGGEIFIVGGAVRDALSGKSPRDVDMSTTMWCEDVRDALKAKNVEEGRANTTYGTVLVSGFGKAEPVDICSFKRPGGTFGFDLKDDIRFRDFTINALYYDPKSQLIADPTGNGMSDVQEKILRPTCKPGDEAQWLKDNSSAPLRLVKFTLRGYTPAPGLVALIRKKLDQCLDDMDSFRKSAAVRSIGASDDAIKKELKRLGFTPKEIDKLVESRSFFSLGSSSSSSRSRTGRGGDSSGSDMGRADDDGFGSWFM